MVGSTQIIRRAILLTSLPMKEFFSSKMRARSLASERFDVKLSIMCMLEMKHVLMSEILH